MTLEVRINYKAWERDLGHGLKGATNSKKRLFSTLTVGLFAFLLTIFSANPEYSLQMITSGVQYWELAFFTRFAGLIAETGYTGVLLTVAFSFLVGVTITNTIIQFRMNQLNFDSIGAVPGFLAGGCASCGVGVLSLLGFGGVLASMPFQGNLLRLGGVLLLLALVIRTGNPDTCKL